MSYSIYVPMKAQLPWNCELFTVCNDIRSIILVMLFVHRMKSGTMRISSDPSGRDHLYHLDLFTTQTHQKGGGILIFLFSYSFQNNAKTSFLRGQNLSNKPQICTGNMIKHHPSSSHLLNCHTQLWSSVTCGMHRSFWTFYFLLVNKKYFYCLKCMYFWLFLGKLTCTLLYIG